MGTLGDLLIRAAAGLRRTRWMGRNTIVEIRGHLVSLGLPAGPTVDDGPDGEA